MQLPLLIVGAGVRAFHTIEDAEALLEPADVRTGGYEVFDSAGLHLQFKIVPEKERMFLGLCSVTLEHVEIVPGEETPTAQARLREAISDLMVTVHRRGLAEEETGKRQPEKCRWTR
jgi:hypothetical protein